jgi:pre-60S factor REI1
METDEGFPELTFKPEQCLFCNMASPDLDTNISHMHKNHGLFIPVDIKDGFLRLAVDLETLMRYLHLVIYGYHECLHCHIQKQTAQAVRQHMMGKGHCRVDLDDEESEFRDFYEEDGVVSGSSESGLDEEEASHSSDDNEEAGGTSGSQPSRRQPSSKVDGISLSLSSGKVVSHRSAPPPRHHRRPLAETKSLLAHRGPDHTEPTLSPTSDDMQTMPDPPGDDQISPADTTQGNTALTRAQRRAETNNKSTLSLALSRLSVNDRAALAHLPAAEQRAIVLTQFKQQDKARQYERRYKSKFDPRRGCYVSKFDVCVG